MTLKRIRMVNPRRLIFIHGLAGNSHGIKATLLRSVFPGLLTPDFSGSLDERMAYLESLLGAERDWTIIGSSLGGLMAALFARQHPRQVSRLILLAPALIWPDFSQPPLAPIDIPTIIYHGSQDELVPPHEVEQIAKQIFTHLEFHLVDDDHGLYKTVQALDWHALLDVSTESQS
jgi:pimeloyl-ACP methyl ester carboxylesterase